MQFSLSRMFQLTVGVAVVSALFGRLVWPLAMLILSGLNGAVTIWFWFVKRALLARLAAGTSFLILASLFLTDWGFSSIHPVVRIAWPILIAACVAELATVLLWLVSGATTPCPHPEASSSPTVESPPRST